MTACDFLVVGGGVAGLSAAWQMARYGRVIVLERETGTGYHSSGRSATYYHFGIGNRPVRLLTQASGAFFFVVNKRQEDAAATVAYYACKANDVRVLFELTLKQGFAAAKVTAKSAPGTAHVAKLALAALAQTLKA